MDSSTVQKLIFAGIWIWIGIISFWKMMKIWLRIQFQFRNHNTSILHLLAWDKSYVQNGLTWNTTSNMNEAGSPTTVRMRPRLSSIQRINRFFRAPESAILATVDQAVENRTNMTSRCIVLYRLYRFAVPRKSSTTTTGIKTRDVIFVLFSTACFWHPWQTDWGSVSQGFKICRLGFWLHFIYSKSDIARWTRPCHFFGPQHRL